MEVAGLAFGIAGLAGAFKDIIDLFVLFTASRDTGRDLAFLETKLDIEKTTLLQWAESVQLLAVDYDKRLDDTRLPLTRILSCIRTLLSDTSNLKQRYCLAEAPAQGPTNGSQALSVRGSAPLMDRFIRDFAAFQIRVRQDKPSVGNRLKWVVRDKEKFQGLVTELGYFISKLRELVPAPSSGTIGCRAHLKRRNLDQDEDGESKRSRLHGSARPIDGETANKILRRIQFHSMDDRRLSVSPAHAETLKWSLEPPNATTRPWSDLTQWLRSGSGLYWVCGKAGSGKSTLLRYLCDHKRTRAHLSGWAAGQKLLVGTHFFWNLGTPEQKTQCGLQRSILYQILNHLPAKIPEVLPRIYADAHDGLRDLTPPSQAEMDQAFRTLQQTSGLGKICLFVDGMDEFDGRCADGIECIQRLAGGGNIKIVVSSRLIPECVSAFGHLPQLQLHHLTRDDISCYVQDRVGSHPYLLRLKQRHGREVNYILSDLTNKARGVFLWVVLACRSLLSGFADSDRILELRRLVDELPVELYEMFGRMLSTIKARHTLQGAKLLRMIYQNEAVHRQVFDSGSDSSESHLPIPALGLARMDDNLVHSSRDIEGAPEACLELEGRLRSRTGGLLEIDYKVCQC